MVDSLTPGYGQVSVERGYIANLEYTKFTNFQFLPMDVSYSRQTVWNIAEIPGRSKQVAQYISGGSRSVSFTLRLVDPSKGIKGYVEQLHSIVSNRREFILKIGKLHRCILTEPIVESNIRYAAWQTGLITPVASDIRMVCAILDETLFEGEE